VRRLSSSTRRAVVIAGVVLALASLAFAGTLLAADRSPRERVAALAVEAVVAPSGNVAVTETFTWDFDTATRRQLLRTIPTTPAAGRPGWAPITDVAAVSRTASDEVSLEPTSGVEVVVIGAADQRITGAHDYRLTYTLGAVASGVAGDAEVELDVVGTLSDVPVDGAVASVSVPGKLVGDDAVVVTSGAAGSRTSLPADVTVVDGATVVSVGPVDLGPEEGISVRIRYDAPVDPAPPVLERRPTTLADTRPGTDGLAAVSITPPPGANPIPLFTVLPLGVLGGALVGWGVVRRWGRDRRWAGSAVDAAFGPGTAQAAGPTPGSPGSPGSQAAGSPSVVSVSESEAQELVTVAFAPPDGVTPGEAGALWRLRVGPEDKVATLVDLAVRGWLVIDEADAGAPKLVWRGAGDPNELREAEQRLLASLFGPTSSAVSSSPPGGDAGSVTETAPPPVTLGKYAPAFAAVWSRLGSDLDPRGPARGWLRSGSGWRALAALVGGLGVALAAAVSCLAVAAARAPEAWPGGWLVVAPLAVVGGLGLGSVLASGGMRSRTAAGFATWLGVEGFRRFVAGSDGEYSRHAADAGILRQYVAWAVAFGEVDRWERACTAAGVDPGEGWVRGGGSMGVSLALLGSSVSRTATAPSSRGGGGGSGSVGGGAGGGGFSSR
jgi:hypothetical protein